MPFDPAPTPPASGRVRGGRCCWRAVPPWRWCWPRRSAADRAKPPTRTSPSRFRRRPRSRCRASRRWSSACCRRWSTSRCSSATKRRRKPTSRPTRATRVAGRPVRDPFDELLRRFFENSGTNNGTPQAKRQVMALGSGFIIDPDGVHRHQQSRGRPREKGDGDPAGQQPSYGQDHRTRREDRPGAAQDRQQEQAALCHLGRQRPGESRRLGRRGRQPVRARRHRDGRDRLGAAAATSTRAPTTISSRSTRRSTAAIPAGRPSTCRAR